MFYKRPGVDNALALMTIKLTEVSPGGYHEFTSSTWSQSKTLTFDASSLIDSLVTPQFDQYSSTWPDYFIFSYISADGDVLHISSKFGLAGEELFEHVSNDAVQFMEIKNDRYIQYTGIGDKHSNTG